MFVKWIDLEIYHYIYSEKARVLIHFDLGVVIVRMYCTKSVFIFGFKITGNFNSSLNHLESTFGKKFNAFGIRHFEQDSF